MVTHYIHRGLAKKHFKENTLTSFKYCFKKKYGVETDLHCTKDNKIVCFHDFNLNRKFKINKKIKDLNYSYIRKISTINKTEIPLLSQLLKASKKKFPLLLELKPVFSSKNLKKLLFETKRHKNCSVISFKEKNLINLYKINKRLSLGLLFNASVSLKNIKIKSKKKYVKFLVLEKKFLPNKKINLIKKKIYYYAIKNKSFFNKYKYSKNLIFENL